MSDPLQTFAQQAQQTTSVFNSINANTTKAFEARRAALTAEANLAINVSQQMEQSRMNDMRAFELNQSLKFNDEKMNMARVEFAAKQKLAPLEIAYETSRLKAGVLQNTIASVSPFLEDMKTEISSTIFELPELAEDVQEHFDGIATGIASQLLVNPNIDVAKEIATKKKQYMDWLNAEKLIRKSAALGKGGKMNYFDDRPAADIEKVSGIYARFNGGKNNEFIRKHDPEYVKSLNTSRDVMILTGQIDPKAINYLNPEDQKLVYKSIESKKHQASLANAMKESRMTLDDLDKESSPELRASLEKQHQSIQAEYAKSLGISLDASKEGGSSGSGDDPKEGGSSGSGDDPKNTEEIYNEFMTSLTEDAPPIKIEGINRELKIEPLISLISSSDFSKKEIIGKMTNDEGKLTKEGISKSLSKVTSSGIIEIAKQPWFIKSLDLSGHKIPNNVIVAGTGFGGVHELDGPIKKAVKVINDSSIPPNSQQKKEAIKVLKDAMPDILLNYGNQ